MKKFVLVAAAAGLVSLAACNTSPAAEAITNNADIIADDIDNNSALLEEAADNTSNTVASELLENQADNLNDQADNVRDEGEKLADNVK